MANARHGDQNPTDGDGLHVLHNFEPANAAALAALAVVAADIGKVARQVDTGDFYMLRSVGPSVWDKINGSGTGDVAGPASSVDDRLALFDGVTGKLLKQGTVTGTAVAAHLPDTANPHATDLGNIGSGTLAELNAAVTDATLDDASDPRTPTAHASTHENGGGDEINVGGLSGLLADGQTPLSHAATHENGGGDEISVAGLSGLLADAQNPTAHASTHSDGGSDEISVEDLATAELNATLVLKPDGAGGLAFGAVGGTGDVVGPASAVDDRLALFDGVTGKLIKQGTVTGAAVAAHLPDTANPHATDVGNLGSGTLAELNAAVTDATLDDASDPRTPTAHAATHENGGGDEINVAGLSGLLADGQTPLSHASTHENGGGDEINVAGLSGLLADAQTPTAHAATHSDGGSDEIAVEDLATASTTLTHVLSPDGAGGLVMRAEAGGVTTPGTTIDLGVVVWDGLTGTAIADAGIREYGKSAIDPTVPTPADGDGYYNTALNMRMTYDGSRSKWLSERTAELWFGRSGNTGTGAYYRGPGNRAYSSTIGRNATHDGTIVSLTYTRNDTDAATFQIPADGVTISTLASAAQKGESITLYNDFSAGAVLGARNASGGNTTQHVHGWAVIRWRA